MADVFTKAKRSAVMAAIKGRGAKSTEVAVRRLFRTFHLQGWRSHLPTLPGRPDFAFPKHRLAIFVDGCFWHGCVRCNRNLTPTTNAAYWTRKIEANVKRDRRVDRQLRDTNWRIVRIWEHDVKLHPDRCVKRIQKMIIRSDVP